MASLVLCQFFFLNFFFYINQFNESVEGLNEFE